MVYDPLKTFVETFRVAVTVGKLLPDRVIISRYSYSRTVNGKPVVISVSETFDKSRNEQRFHLEGFVGLSKTLNYFAESPSDFLDAMRDIRFTGFDGGEDFVYLSLKGNHVTDSVSTTEEKIDHLKEKDRKEKEATREALRNLNN